MMPHPTETTGRYLVLLEHDAVAAGTRMLYHAAGLRLAATTDTSHSAMPYEAMPYDAMPYDAMPYEAMPYENFEDADGLVLPELGVAVVTATPDQAVELTRAAAEHAEIVFVEPERVVRAIAPAVPVAESGAAEETMLTWGLQAIGADASTASGAGVRVAILDTGLDLQHPDLADRTIVTRSFILDQQVQDGHGHGTHCTGTACGPRSPEITPGYGVAYESDIYAGKVLNDQGAGTDGDALQGISWAISNECRVISMSFGAPTEVGQPHSRIFEQVARRTMRLGAIIIAAVGNESDRRRGYIAPVGHPANCPSIMAVGAVDVQGRIANFSCGTIGPVGQVDLVGPGVDIHSSWPMPTRYRRISGTSMATPHVAGVAAVIAGLRPQSGPHELWARLTQLAQRLNLPSTDVGAGLVQVP